MNNDSMKVQATIDLPSAKKVDEQIRALEKSISKLKVSGQFNDTALKNLTKQLNTLRVNIGTANFSPTALKELTNQVEKALSNINISGVNIGKEITKSIKNNIDTGIVSQNNKISDSSTSTIIQNEKKKQEAYKSTVDTVIDYVDTISKLYNTGKEIKSLGSGLLKLSKSDLILAGLTTAITVGATAWDIYKNHQERAVEALKETLQKSRELTETYKQEQADLDSTIEKYKDLNEQLTNAHLTTEEYNGIKKQLIGLQDDLVSKYGNEADAIDIVNGKYDEQIKKLETLSRQKAQEFVYTNFSNVEEAQNFLNNTQSITKQHNINDEDVSSYNKYLQGLNGRVNVITRSTPDYEQSYLEYSYKGTPEEKRKQIEADITALIKQYGYTNEYANVIIKDLSELLNREEISSESINQAKQVLLNFAEASVKSDSEIQSAYDSLVDGIEKYNNALETGEGIDKAYSNYEKLRDEFKNVSADILGIEFLYDNLSNKLNEPLDLSFKLDKNIENGNRLTKMYLEELQGVTSDQLRSLDYDDLLSVNSLNNYEDALGHLVKQLDVSEAGVDALIDRLIELGYVTDSVEIQNKENILHAMGFDRNASSANAAKRNIIATNVYNSLTDEQRYLFGNNLDLIPPESYNWTEQQWLDFINELRDSSEVDININPTKSLDSIKSTFSEFESIYEDIHNGTTVAADSIEKLNDAFGELDGGTALQKFRDVLTTMPDDIDAQQDALNNLATAYIDNSDLIKNLTEDNADYTISELEKIGVMNAEEVVQSRLYNQEENLKKAQEEQKNTIDSLTNAMSSCNSASDLLTASTYNAMLASIDLNNASANEIAGLINAANAAGVDSTALKNLIADKIRSGQIVLTTNGDISNLVALCQALDGTYTYLQKYSQAKDTIRQGGTINGGGTADVQMLKGLEALAKNELKNALKDYGGGNTANVQYSAPSYSPSISDSSSSGSASTAETKTETIDWIEINLKRLEEELNRLDKKSSNVYSLWGKRNTALNGQIAKTREEIILQQKAYDGYMSKANSIGLSDTYISKVQNGMIQIEDITDEDLADKISEYQTWYEKAIKCKDTIQELNISLGDLASQKFDNLQTEYDGVISTFESFGSLVDETIKRTEEHGYFVAKDYYKQLIDYENKTLNTLQQQYAALIQSRDEALKKGDIEENSQEWQNMTLSILDVKKAIEQSTTSVVKFNKEIRNLDWETFDYTAEKINQMTQESDYLIGLMENYDLYNETGAFTSEGKATTALHGINYNIYMQQALDCAKELKKIEQEISEDSANKNLIERREELLNQQQKYITNAEAEKNAIKSLVEEGINIHLDALSSLIDKYKEAMNSAKDLYDYQKNISSQVKEISNLEKQILAYEGDDSEEVRKIIQETKLSLEEARTELKETEWDKYISETEQLLDTLYDDYEEVLNARLDNIDALVAGMIDMVNSNGSEIRNTVKDVADKVGYTITDSLSKALGEGSHLTVLISNFSTKFDTVATTLQSSIDAIKAYVYKMIEEGKHKVDSERKPNTDPSSPNSSASSNSTHNSSNGSNSTSFSNSSSATPNSGDGIAKVGDAVTFVNGKYHEDSWGNGKSGNQLLGGTVYITKIAPNSPYPYHISRTSKFGEANLGWVKLEQLKGYAKGSRKINQNQLAWTQENGNEMLYRSKDGALLTPLGNGDMVFTNEMTQKLWEMAKGNIAMPTFNPPKINTNLEQENKTINNDNKITITLPNVKNYNEFKSELQNDNKFVGFVQEVTLGEALGHNSMKRKKY